LTEVAEMHHSEHTTAAAARTPSTLGLIDEELSKFVGVDVS